MKPKIILAPLSGAFLCASTRAARRNLCLPLREADSIFDSKKTPFLIRTKRTSLNLPHQGICVDKPSIQSPVWCSKTNDSGAICSSDDELMPSALEFATFFSLVVASKIVGYPAWSSSAR